MSAELGLKSIKSDSGIKRGTSFRASSRAHHGAQKPPVRMHRVLGHGKSRVRFLCLLQSGGLGGLTLKLSLYCCKNFCFFLLSKVETFVQYSVKPEKKQIAIA